jgi:hypothetical protein
MMEMLVVLKIGPDPAGGGVADRVRTRYTVVAALPPRLLVVQLADNELAALQHLDGVETVTVDPAGLDISPPLSEVERLFAAGWAARGSKSGPRTGEGKAWDAPGFIPPGRPRR